VRGAFRQLPGLNSKSHSAPFLTTKTLTSTYDSQFTIKKQKRPTTFERGKLNCHRDNSDLTLDAAFTGKTLDEATNKGDAFRHLGYWSDGRPVMPAIVSDDLATVPRVFPAAGIKGFGRLLIPTVAPRDPTVSKAANIERR